MLRSPFLWKLYAGYAALIVATTLIAVVFGSRVADRSSRAGLDRHLLATAEMLGELARDDLPAAEPGGELQARAVRLGQDLGVRLTVIAADGTVIADSHEDPGLMEPHDLRPEVASARTGGIGRSDRSSATLGQEMTYLAQAVRDEDGRLIGYARSSMPRAVTEQQLRSLRMSIILAGVVATLVALPLGFFFARRITRPIAEMTSAATAIARGELHRRVPHRGRDEIGRLAAALDVMADQLEDRLSTITADRNRLQAVLAGITDGVVAVDARGRIVHLNAPAAELLGTGIERATGRTIWEVSRLGELDRVLSEALRLGAGRHGELHIPRDGRDQDVVLNAAPIHGAGGAASGAVAVLHDITELRRLEAIRRDFVANVSHELKTPLTAIRGLVETIIDDPVMDAAVRGRFLAKVRGQCDRLGALVGDLLTLSRLEATDAGMEREAVDLRSVVRTSCDGLLEPARAKRITVEYLLPDRPVVVAGDREFLRQAVDNLVDNAIKYTPEGGRVTARVRTEGETAEISVRDTGIGIDPVDRPRIFERFYRVDKARSRELGGTGLGLSIVKHIVLAHGGSVRVESTPGSGSTFVARLPLEAERTVTTDEPPGASGE